jgi:type VI secretion system protein ImpA
MAEGAIESREDAIRALERICAWIERNEPASPAPIFIRRSQELLKKSFIEIIRDLLPDNVKQIEHFAGKGHS